MNSIIKSSRLYIWQYVFISTFSITSIYGLDWLLDGAYVFFSLSLLASAAFIHNDIQDQAVDKENGLERLVNADKKTITLAYITTVVLSISSLLVAYLYSLELLGYLFSVCLLLYSYNKFARKILLVSSIISVVASLSPMWVVPLITNRPLSEIFLLLSSAFLLLLAREWIFDARDKRGDRVANRITLATVFGSKNTIQYSLLLMFASFITGFYWIFDTYGFAITAIIVMIGLVVFGGLKLKTHTEENDVSLSVQPLISMSYIFMFTPMLLIIFLNFTI